MKCTFNRYRIFFVDNRLQFLTVVLIAGGFWSAMDISSIAYSGNTDSVPVSPCAPIPFFSSRLPFSAPPSIGRTVPNRKECPAFALAVGRGCVLSLVLSFPSASHNGMLAEAAIDLGMQTIPDHALHVMLGLPTEKLRQCLLQERQKRTYLAGLEREVAEEVLKFLPLVPLAALVTEYQQTIVARTNQYVQVWNDAGSGAHQDVGLWRPALAPGFIFFGDHAKTNTLRRYDPPTVKLLMARDHAQLFRPALDFRLIWHKERGLQGLWVWEAVAPEGYRSLGVVGTVT
eukprot:g82042.t1